MAVQATLLVAAVVIAAKVYGDLSHNRNFLFAVALAFVPPLLVGAAFGGSRRTSRPDSEPDTFLDHLWQRIRPSPAQATLDRMCLIGAALLFLVALGYWFKQGRSNEAIVVNILSIVALFIAVYRLDRGRAVSAPVATDAPRLPVELAIVAAIVAFAAFMRLWQLDSVPFGVWYDEGETGLEALRIFNGIAYTPIGTYSTAQPVSVLLRHRLCLPLPGANAVLGTARAGSDRLAGCAGHVPALALHTGLAQRRHRRAHAGGVGLARGLQPLRHALQHRRAALRDHAHLLLALGAAHGHGWPALPGPD